MEGLGRMPGTHQGSLGVLGLIELDLEVAGDFEERNKPVAMVFDVLHKLHALRAKGCHCLTDVVAIERYIGCSGGNVTAFSWVNSQVRLRCVEDKPAAANVSSGEAQLVSEEC